MADTREIFSLRKEGRIDEALRMARELYEVELNDEWVIKAYAWCLYDKIKALIATGNYPEAQRFGSVVERLPIDDSDDILFSSVQRVILNLNPDRRLISEAKEKSKTGNHEEAISLLKQAKVHFPNDRSIDEAIAWELYRLKKTIFEQKPIPLLEAKKVLAEYMALSNPRPSIIHSQFLRLSDKIIDQDGFNSIQFLKLWDLNNLRAEDYDPVEFEGKKYASLAEKVIQHVSKLVVSKRLVNEVDFFMPFLESAIKKYPDNIWLNYYKVKFYQLLNRNEEALKFVIPIAKLKSDDWWTWGLLGELFFEIDREKSLSCFCKALLCKSEEKFLTNTRIRLAQILIGNKLFNEAKTEIDLAIKTREKEGYKISGLLLNFTSEAWYLNANRLENNTKLYASNTKKAEQILFDDLPWININLGDQYFSGKNPDKPRRKIYASLKDAAVEEFSVSASKVKGYKNLSVGSPFKMKAEKDKDGKLKVYVVEAREEGFQFDVFPRYIGNISRVVQKDGKVESINFVFSEGSKVIEWASKNIKLLAGFDATPGQPVSLVVSKRVVEDKKSDTLSYYLPTLKTVYDILDIKERPEGAPFDCIETKIGIVDHINNDRGVIHFIVNKALSGTAKMAICADRVNVGDTISVRPVEMNGENGKYFKALTCCKTNEEPPAGLKKKFSGMLQEMEGYGFVDDIFVAGHLFKELKLGEVPFVSGEAILNYNKRKGTWGWAAISIS